MLRARPAKSRTSGVETGVIIVRSGRLRVLSSVLAAATAIVFCGPPGPAHADEPPPFVGWSEVLPPLVTNFEAGSSDDCVAGRAACVRQTIREMQKRFGPLAERCDHDAVFSLAYLRTTEYFFEASETDGFFNDTPRINHQAVAFARMYFDAYDDWAAGRVARVAPAWRVAFEHADAGTVSGSGNLLLGMNAHVNRDLPFVLVAAGMVGSGARKYDHDQVNKVLNRVVQPLMAELAARFDPALANIRTPYGIGYTALLQMLVGWRENAWRQADRLASASTAAERERVAESIEAGAEAQAHLIATAEAYHPPLTSSKARDAYCRSVEGGGS